MTPATTTQATKNPAFTRIKGTKPVRWTTILGIVLVPIVAAGILLWGLWNPTERLDTMTAAVVNNDKPVKIGEQTVPLGRVLAGELIDGDADTNFTWELTDESDAKDGLKDGRYTSVVTIPENFSAAATSTSGGADKAKAAHIDISESDQGRLVDSALSGIVTQTATGVMNEQLGEQFVGNVYVGFAEIQGGVADAADGAKKLADGGKQLGDGASQLAEGTTQLSAGVQELGTGASGLSSGAESLTSGIGQYTAGASALAENYAPLSAGATGAVTQLKTMSGALAQLGTDSAGPQQELGGGLAAAGAGAEQLGKDIPVLIGGCMASGAAPEFCNTLSTTLQARAGEIGGGLGTAGTGAQGLAAANETFTKAIGGAGGAGGAGGDPSAQLDQLNAGLVAFGTGLNDFAAQGSVLSSGATEFASGASQLSSGVSALAASTPALAEGAAGLADGVKQSREGANSLAKGLDEAADGIPNYDEAQRETIAKAAVTPVEIRGGSDELFSNSGVPLFTGVALWAGALAMFLVLSPLWRRTREAARGVGAITMRSALPALLLGGVQGAIAGVVLPIALGYGFGQGVQFFGLALVAGVSFALLVQGLSALLGGFGRFVAFAMLVVAFAVGIVSTVPPELAAVGDASPIGALLGGFQTVAAESGRIGGSILLLILWGLLGLLLTALAVRRARKER